MTEDANQSNAWKAPYISYETFTNFFEKKLGDNPLPPRIDTYFLDNYAGSVRPLLLATLKSLGMIGENNEVLEPLRVAVQSPAARKQVMRRWAEEFYAEQLALANNHATAQMLWESFSRRGYNGSTLRKGVVFYLALVEDLGLPNSAHFKAPKAAGAAKGAKPRNSVTGNAGQGASGVSTSQPDQSSGGSGNGETRVVTIGTAGTVTITVDVRWLDLPDQTFVTLRRLVRELTELGEPESVTDEVIEEEDETS